MSDTPTASDSRPRLRTVAERNRLAEEYVGYAAAIARRKAGEHPNLDVDDLVGDAFVGLVDAAERWDETRGVPFKGYAAHRISGAILDGIRRMDQVPRSRRRRERNVSDGIAALQSQLGRDPSPGELASHLRWSVDEVCYHTDRAQVFTADESTLELVAGTEPEDEFDTETVDLVLTILELADRLPQVHRTVFLRCVAGGESLGAVADMLGVTTSRVSQLRTEAVDAVRHQMKDCDALPPRGKYGFRTVVAAHAAALVHAPLSSPAERLNAAANVPPMPHAADGEAVVA